jgi:hypothetical protein
MLHVHVTYYVHVYNIIREVQEERSYACVRISMNRYNDSSRDRTE